MMARVFFCFNFAVDFINIDFLVYLYSVEYCPLCTTVLVVPLTRDDIYVMLLLQFAA